MGVVSHVKANPHEITVVLHVGNALVYPNRGAAIAAKVPEATSSRPSLRKNQRFPLPVISRTLAAAVTIKISKAGKVMNHDSHEGVSSVINNITTRTSTIAAAPCSTSVRLILLSDFSFIFILFGLALVLSDPKPLSHKLRQTLEYEWDDEPSS